MSSFPMDYDWYPFLSIFSMKGVNENIEMKVN